MDEFGLYYDEAAMTIKAFVDNDDLVLKRFKLKCFAGSLSARDRQLLAVLPFLVILMRQEQTLATAAGGNRRAVARPSEPSEPTDRTDRKRLRTI